MRRIFMSLTLYKVSKFVEDFYRNPLSIKYKWMGKLSVWVCSFLMYIICEIMYYQHERSEHFLGDGGIRRLQQIDSASKLPKQVRLMYCNEHGVFSL